MGGEVAHSLEGREGGGGRRQRRYAVAGAALGAFVLGLSCIALMPGDDGPTVLRGVTTEGRKLFPKMQLWESADSPNHDPYYNIFDYHKELKRDKRSNEVENENAHKTWSPNAVIFHILCSSPLRRGGNFQIECAVPIPFPSLLHGGGDAPSVRTTGTGD